MKKTIIILTLIVILLFTGCKPQIQPSPDDIIDAEKYNQYDCFLGDYSMSIHPIKLKINDSILYFYPEDYLINTTHTILFANHQLTGTYSGQSNFPLSTKFNFRTKDNTEFSIEPHTGHIQVIDFTWTDEFISNHFNSEIPDISEEDAKNIADSYASEFIDVSSGYTVTISENKISRSMNDKVIEISLYDILYTKYYEGILTSDRIKISITSKGNFASLVATDPNSYESLMTDDFDIDKLHQAVNNKMNSMFNGIVLSDFAYEIEDEEIFKYDNHIWLECDVRYHYSLSDGDTAEHLLVFYVVVK